MLKTTRPSLRMLALPNAFFTSAGEDQSALNACRYHARVGSLASENLGFFDQKPLSVDRAMIRTPHVSPILGLRQPDGSRHRADLAPRPAKAVDTQLVGQRNGLRGISGLGVPRVTLVMGMPFQLVAGQSVFCRFLDLPTLSAYLLRLRSLHAGRPSCSRSEPS
jgi:hypothetical protein